MEREKNIKTLASYLVYQLQNNIGPLPKPLVLHTGVPATVWLKPDTFSICGTQSPNLEVFRCIRLFKYVINFLKHSLYKM